MNTNDLMLFNVLSALLPLASLVLSLMLVISTVQTVRAAQTLEVATTQAQETQAILAHQTTEPVNVLVQVERAARGRVSTAMRSTRHPHTADQYAAA